MFFGLAIFELGLNARDIFATDQDMIEVSGEILLQLGIRVSSSRPETVESDPSPKR
jgi:hypothetical protein